MKSSFHPNYTPLLQTFAEAVFERRIAQLAELKIESAALRGKGPTLFVCPSTA